jgi:hypothetical protein
MRGEIFELKPGKASTEAKLRLNRQIYACQTSSKKGRKEHQHRWEGDS